MGSPYLALDGRRALNDDWEVEVDEQRPRVAPNDGAGAHHTDDLVLKARGLR